MAFRGLVMISWTGLRRWFPPEVFAGARGAVRSDSMAPYGTVPRGTTHRTGWPVTAAISS